MYPKFSRPKRIHRSDKSLPEDLFDQLEDEPLDLLDQHKTRSALRSSAHLKRKQESDDEPEIDPEGRLIVCGGKTKKEKATDPDSDVRSEAGSFKSVNSRKTQKRRKTSDSGWAYTGNEYASKKASGDMRRKDKLEPYAYWPLDRKMMSRRPEHRAAARKGMARAVKMAKKLEGKSASTALSTKLLNFNSQKKGSKRKSR
jgi:ribosomal RNA-processing protein 12